MTKYSNADIILNPAGEVYHLGLRPEDLADTIITVGDPDRVPLVSRHFDSVSVIKSKREFTTHTGEWQGEAISVLSTGMGSSNIEIVFNEIDILKNFDFENKIPISSKREIRIVRLGTSGSIQKDISCGDILVSRSAFALDGLGQFYPILNGSDDEIARDLRNSFIANMTGLYHASANADMLKAFGENTVLGLSYTAQGFYSPQFRNNTRYSHGERHLNEMSSLRIKGQAITNIEMETAAIYHMADYFGFQAVSLSAILANRITGEFSKAPDKDVNELIHHFFQNLNKIFH